MPEGRPRARHDAVRESDGELDTGHITDGEEIPLRSRPPLKHAAKQRTYSLAALFPGCQEQRHQGWSKNSKQLQQWAERRVSRKREHHDQNPASPGQPKREQKECEERTYGFPSLQILARQQSAGTIDLSCASLVGIARHPSAVTPGGRLNLSQFIQFGKPIKQVHCSAKCQTGVQS